MKSRLYNGVCVIVVITSFALFSHPLRLFAATTDKDLTLDDGTGDSPQVIMKDGDDNTLTLQKMDAGEADIINNEGDINLKPSGDTDDYLKLLTIGNASYLYWLGILTYTNNPGLRVNPATGKLEYRDGNSATWVALDDISGGSTTFGGLSDTSFGGGPAQGDVVYHNGTNWVNLGAGTSGEFLQTQGAAANPQWSAAGGGDITAVGDVTTGNAFTATTGNDGTTLYFEGSTSDANEVALTSANPGVDVTLTLPAATDTLVGKATTDTLTNKTFDANGTGNSLSNVDVADLADGTDGQLITWDANAAPATVATGSSGQVLTSNGAGTAPTFQAAAGGGLSNVVEDTTPQLGGQLDVNGKAIGNGTLELIKFSETASAVNEITVTNAATGNGASISSSGGDTNVDLLLVAKGSGVVKADGVEVVTLTGAQTLTNKTLTSPVISAISNTGTLTLPTSTDTLVGRATTDTLTNKTFDANGTGNSLSNVDVADLADGTDGQLITWDANAAPATVATGSSGQVLTSNGAGTAPTFQAAAGGGLSNVVEDTTPQLGGQLDVNGKAIGNGTLELIKFSETASAVNEITVTNAATGNGASISSTGGDTNVDLLLVAKGTGVVKADGVEVVTLSGTHTLTNKTFDANGTGNSLSNVDVADLANGTDGQLITWGADAAPAVVATGSSGQVLTSNGAGTAPTFQADSSGLKFGSQAFTGVNFSDFASSTVDISSAGFTSAPSVVIATIEMTNTAGELANSSIRTITATTFKIETIGAVLAGAGANFIVHWMAVQ